MMGDEIKTRVTMFDLKLLQTVGVGRFGRVKVVVHKPTGVVYALKSLTKTKIVSSNLLKQSIRERTIMLSCEHTFLPQLAATFQDADQLHMMLELVSGGTLRTRLRMQSEEKFATSAVQFYAANMVAVVSYLHDRSIAHRDLNPDNFLIDTQGYLKLTDFGAATVMPEGRSFTLCGTPHYMAPEMLLKKGHGLAVDWWALGIIIFEMTVGEKPFVSAVKDEKKSQVMMQNNTLQVVKPEVADQTLFDRITTAEKGPTFPWWLWVGPTHDIIVSLLQIDPDRRLGSSWGAGEVAAHVFFHGLKVAEMESRGAKPPYTPNVKDPLDLSYFNKYTEGHDGSWMVELVPKPQDDDDTPFMPNLAFASGLSGLSLAAGGGLGAARGNFGGIGMGGEPFAQGVRKPGKKNDRGDESDRLKSHEDNTFNPKNTGGFKKQTGWR